MAFELTGAQIQALAPDAASTAAAKKLAKPAPWRGLGWSERALWGECQGSAVYQTQVSLVDLATKCSCPSRKFPCKHALALLFLAVESRSEFAHNAEPEWVTSWFDKRGAAEVKKQARTQAAADKPVDEAAQAKRAEKRHEKILAGLDQLDAWLSDLVRQGLARVPAEGFELWDGQARRLVDAQAPGLASRVRRAARHVGSGEAWAARLLEELGSLWLLGHAYRRIGELEAPLAADLRRLMGFTLDQTEVLAHGHTVEDEWVVLAEVESDDDRMRMQRVWLRGSKSGQSALILQFAVAGGRFAEALLPGTRFPGVLAFWPSAAPQRALIAERRGPAVPVSGAPEGGSIADCLARFADTLSRMPWVDRELFVLRELVPAPIDGSAETGAYAVVDAGGAALPLQRGEHDVLIAVSGGHPVTLLGEWNGDALAPLRVWSGGRSTPLVRSTE